MKPFLLNRQACAIESAAIQNPDRNIFVLFVTPVGHPKNRNESSPILKALQSYSNIFLRNINIPKYVKGTPVEEWLMSGKLFTSIHLHVHVSDFLRLLTIYKYGGTYLDLDFIFLQSLDGLQRNYLTEQHDQRVANSVIDFTHNSIGHEMITVILLYDIFNVFICLFFYMKCL